MAICGVGDHRKRSLVNVRLGAREPVTRRDARAAAARVWRLIGEDVGATAANERLGGGLSIRWYREDDTVVGAVSRADEGVSFVGVIGVREPSAPALANLLTVALTYELGEEVQTAAEKQALAASQAGELLISALECLRLPVALIDRDAIVHLANRAAITWFSESDGIALSGRRLVANDPCFAARLKTACRALGASPAAPPRPLALRQDGGLRVLTIVSLGPTSRYGVAVGTDGATSDCAAATPVLEALGLTPAERRLAVHLAGGCSIEEAAELANIRVTTARSYVKQIYGKTGVRRQSELVAVLHRLTPAIGSIQASAR